MRDFAEYRETQKSIRSRFSAGELVKLLSGIGKEQYLMIVHRKKNGRGFYYSGDIIEADEYGTLVVVQRTYHIAEEQLSRIPGARYKK